MGILKKVPKKYDKELYIIRGLPGSGRTCLSKGILSSKTGVILSSDDYFYINNIYTYNSKKVNEAIESTIINCEESCKNGILCIIIDDSNIKRWEVRPYVELAKRYNYKVIIREPETTWWKTRDIEEMSKRTSHNISIQAMKKLLQNWDVDFSINSILKEEIPINKIESLYKYYNYAATLSTSTTTTTTTTTTSSSSMNRNNVLTSSMNYQNSSNISYIKTNGSSNSKKSYLAPKPQRLVNNARSQPYFKEINQGFNEERPITRGIKGNRNNIDITSSTTSTNYYSDRVVDEQNSNPYRVCRPAVKPYSEEDDIPPAKYERRGRSENRSSKTRYYDDSIIPDYKNGDINKRKRSNSIGENEIFKKRNSRYGRNSSVGYTNNEGFSNGRSSSLGYNGRITSSDNSRGFDSSRYGGNVGSSRRSSSVGNESYGYSDRVNRYKNRFEKSDTILSPPPPPPPPHQHPHQHPHHRQLPPPAPPPPPPIIKQKKNNYYSKSSSTSFSYRHSEAEVLRQNITPQPPHQHPRQHAPPPPPPPQHHSHPSSSSVIPRGGGGGGGGNNQRYSKQQQQQQQPPPPMIRQRDGGGGGSRRNHSRNRY